MSTNIKERLVRQTISKNGRFKLQARVTPLMGANLVSFTVDGTEWIYWNEAAFLSERLFTGAFNMFPTPCRLADCSYEFEGKKIVQTKRGEDVFIHGLIRDEAMEFRNRGDSITSRLEIDPSHPVYEAFPYRCVFSITHALHESGLTVGFELENKDTGNIPYGYGIHPFWMIHGERRDVSVRIPCDFILELKDLVPTGAYLPVEGTNLDLRAPKTLENLYIDNAFWKRKPGDTAEMQFRALGKKMVIEASDNFPHMIVYAPEGQPFVCVENLTTCPNAPNLVSAGKGTVAAMGVLPPGKTASGWIEYTISNL